MQIATKSSINMSKLELDCGRTRSDTLTNDPSVNNTIVRMKNKIRVVLSLRYNLDRQVAQKLL